MKWYERQKQLYAQKNEPEQPSQPQEDVYTSSYVEPEVQEPVYEEPNYQEDVQEEELYEQPVDEPVYEDEHFDNNQFDEMMGDNEYYEEPPRFTNPQVPPMPSYDATTISKGTVLQGNIETDGDLVIQGHVKGDIICNANLSIFGVVEGTINCNNAYFDNAILVGDIGCSGNMQLSESTTIDGNVEAYDILNGGRIKGNVTVAEGIHFLATSAIVGDVSASNIEIERGAVIQGNVTIRQEIYFEGK